MQRANAQAGSGDASPEAAERFTARGTSGRRFVVEKTKDQVLENSLQGLEWSGGGPSYRLQNGDAVERIDESTYRIVRTREEVRREEGQATSTQHHLSGRC